MPASENVGPKAVLSGMPWLPCPWAALLTMSLKAPRTAAVTMPRHRPRAFSTVEAQSSR